MSLGIFATSSVNATYSFGNAAAAFEHSNGTALIRSGCSNCTLACQNLDQVFGSPATFQNCLSLPSVISSLDQGFYASSDRRLLVNEFGIAEGSDLGTPIVANITGCFSGYLQSCRNDTVCQSAYRELKVESQCQAFLSNSSTFPIATSEDHGTLDCINAICSAITADASTDIVGIGVRIPILHVCFLAKPIVQVFISYFIQAGFALGAFSLLILWDFGLYYLLLCGFSYKLGYKKARQRAFDLSEGQFKHLERLIPALVEFHKTQCFFMFAVQVSALASMKARLFGATSLQQLQNNYCVITVLAFGGFVPITFILFELRMLHQKSWYMLLLSSLSVAMSAATYFTASNFELSAKDISTQGTTYNGCGLANPTSFCLTNGCEIYGSHHGLGQVGAFILSLLVILGLFLEHCHVERWPGVKNIWRSFSSRFGKTGKDIAFGCVGFLIVVFHFVFFGEYLQDLSVFARFSIGNVRYKNYGAVEIFNSFDWSFGQIVALVVWLPPICEYIVLELGMSNLSIQ